MTPDEAFAITAEERARLDAAPFLHANEHDWASFASAIHLHVLAAYTEGQITLERALEVMWSCSLGCRLTDRITLMALTARRALQNPPTAPKKHVPNPTWVRQSAAALVQMFRTVRPDDPIVPNDSNKWTTPILEDAIAWLVALGLCEPIKPRTLYEEWYLPHKKTTPDL